MARHFYIIARTNPIEGIGALIGVVTNHSAYAEDCGMIPIVDLKHYKNIYFKDGREFKDNSWEYFFEQPAGYTLDDIKDDDEVTITSNKFAPSKFHKLTCKALPVNEFKAPSRRIESLKQQYKSYIRPNKQLLEFSENKYNALINEQDIVLGVLARGTDYLIKKPVKENKQPQPKTIMKKVKQYLKKYPEINKIYLATEDDAIFNMFKKEFGEMLLDNGQYRYKYGKEDQKSFIADMKIDREDHEYHLGFEYFSSLYILSKCNYFIGGRCSGTKVAWLLADNWKDCYIWDMGVYTQDVIKYSLTNFFKIVNEPQSDGFKHKFLVILGHKFDIGKKEMDMKYKKAKSCLE